MVSFACGKKQPAYQRKSRGVFGGLGGGGEGGGVGGGGVMELRRRSALYQVLSSF